jgi:hypothetical protein
MPRTNLFLAKTQTCETKAPAKPSKNKCELKVTHPTLPQISPPDNLRKKIKSMDEHSEEEEEEVEAASQEVPTPEEPPKKGLFSMKFMQKKVEEVVQEEDREMTHADVMLTSRHKYLHQNATDEEMQESVDVPFSKKKTRMRVNFLGVDMVEPIFEVEEFPEVEKPKVVKKPKIVKKVTSSNETPEEVVIDTKVGKLKKGARTEMLDEDEYEIDSHEKIAQAFSEVFQRYF